MLEGSSSDERGNDGEEQIGSTGIRAVDLGNEGDVKKAAESKILCYHKSLTRGCGDGSCTNINCVSSGKITGLNSDEAAVRALQLFTSHAPVCHALQPSPIVSSLSHKHSPDAPVTNVTTAAFTSVATTSASAVDNTSLTNSMENSPSCSNQSTTSQPSTKLKATAQNDMSGVLKELASKQKSIPKSSKTNDKDKSVSLDYELFTKTMEQCKKDQNYAKLRMLLWSVFSNEMSLKISFIPKTSCPSKLKNLSKVESCKKNKVEEKPQLMCVDPIPSEISCKEQLRSAESDLDKDIDSALENDDMSCQESNKSNADNDESSILSTQPLIEAMQMDVSQDSSNLCAMDTSAPDTSGSSSTGCGSEEVVAGPSSGDVNTLSGSHVTIDSADHMSDIASASPSSSIKVMTGEPSSSNSIEGNIIERTLPGYDKNTKVLGLPFIAGNCNFAIGHTVLKTKFTEPNIDFIELSKCYELLKDIPECEYVSTLLNAQIRLLTDSLVMMHKDSKSEFHKDLKIVDILLILMENPRFISDNDYTECLLASLCEVFTLLGEQQKAILVVYLAKNWTTERLQSFLAVFHHLITIKLITSESGVGSNNDGVQYNKTICSATASMQLVLMVSVLAGEVDLPLLRDMPPPEPVLSSLVTAQGSKSSSTLQISPPEFDPLSELLGVHPLDSRRPLIPFSEFYDEFLSEVLEVDKDYSFFKSGDIATFSFLRHPYILTPAIKALALYYDNRIRMYSVRRIAMFHNLTEGLPTTPYLRLRVRREHIINDALVELEVVAMESPSELRKQLVVEFEGEQGIDEGGVSKEFFQLITEQLFCPDYGMFNIHQDTGLVWFNPQSFESSAQFSLVGLVLGLAIYNNVILDLHFPPVLYKKLCGKPGTFQDLRNWNPTVYRSMLSMLEYEGDDMEDVFVQNFRVGYQDMFGECLWHNLKEDGENVMVGQHNKQEFVSLYSDWLLNSMVGQQFGPFLRGFLMVTEESPLTKLFRPEELELLLCGSQEYDFSELQKSAEYDGGYSSCSAVVTWFWQLVTAMAAEDQKRLLQFATGSARAPVGGLSHLKLVIARHGPDTDRLPTAHTCFNVLLLPEYCSKDKLQDRLLKAIKYSHGFGML